MTGYFIQGFIYLCAAIITVPISKRLGLGSVLGYLIAGVLIGPITGLVGGETAIIQHFAEFGVVMMLFVVGLELAPSALWQMRVRLVGLGGLQVGITAALIMLIAMALGLSWNYALVIGLILSLSSTAVVLQTFSEKGLMRTSGGQSAFSVLLFQDIAVIPMLALIPLLAVPELMLIPSGGDGGHAELSLVDDLSPLMHTLVVLSSIVAIVVAGHFLSRPLFRYIAASRLPEIFTAAALMIVIGISALMSLIGLSPALGTFLSGVVLANSEFRHELESNLEPFKGILLSLFFITVGAGIDLELLMTKGWTIIGITLALMCMKCLILLGISFVFGIKKSSRWLFGLSLAQAGEFGFVLLSYTHQHGVLPEDLTKFISMIVALSMFLTPLLFIAYEKLIVPRYQQDENREADTIDQQKPIIIAGIGRFGQIVNRYLVASGFETVVLDHKVRQIEAMKRINVKAFYGDATRPDLLHSAGIEKASALIVAFDDKEKAVELVSYVHRTYPHVRIYARAYDRGHNYELRHAGADLITSETYFSALKLGKHILIDQGVHPFKATQLEYAFVETETKASDEMYDSWLKEGESKTFGQHYIDLFIELENKLTVNMAKDRSDRHDKTEREWTPPPKDYIDVLKKESKE